MIVTNMIVTNGQRVAITGRLEATTDLQHIKIWAQAPFQRDRDLRPPGGDVFVRLRDYPGLPEGTLATVVGVWSGSMIEDATLTETDAFATTRVSASSDKLSTGAAGDSLFLGTMRAIRAAGVPILATGSTEDTAWAHVMLMNAELERIHRESPMRLELYPAIVPSQ